MPGMTNVPTTPLEDYTASMGYKRTRPPDRALLVIHAGKALYLEHIGPGIGYYLGECNWRDDVFTEPNGVYIWEGVLHVETVRHPDGDVDAEEWLDGTLRLATFEEWEAHLSDDYAWDRSDWIVGGR